MKVSPKLKQGFTLIEIVIVLAIAALIMVIVFLAVQGAQRSRRDTQRKNDANRILALAENAASSSSGNYPGAANGIAFATFQTSYIAKEDLKDPTTGTAYTTLNGIAIPTAVGTINMSAGAQCTNGNIASSTNARQFAVQIATESGTYCISN